MKLYMPGSALCQNMILLHRRSRLSYENFAEKIGISKSSLQRIEAGLDNINLKTLSTIAEGLHLHPALPRCPWRRRKNFGAFFTAWRPQMDAGRNNRRMPEAYGPAASLLRRLGFQTRYIGFPYLSYALALVLADHSYLYQLFKRLYPDTARAFQTSAACVEKDLRTLIRSFWQEGGGQALGRLAPRPLLRRPTIGELLALLSGYFQDGGR